MRNLNRSNLTGGEEDEEEEEYVHCWSTFYGTTNRKTFEPDPLMGSILSRSLYPHMDVQYDLWLPIQLFLVVPSVRTSNRPLTFYSLLFIFAVICSANRKNISLPCLCSHPKRKWDDQQFGNSVDGGQVGHFSPPYENDIAGWNGNWKGRSTAPAEIRLFWYQWCQHTPGSLVPYILTYVLTQVSKLPVSSKSVSFWIFLFSIRIFCCCCVYGIFCYKVFVPLEYRETF